MAVVPADLQLDATYIVELIEFEDGVRRLYFRPEGSPRSKWFRYETIPLSGRTLREWSDVPDIWHFRSSCLTNGEGFVDCGLGWKTMEEWDSLNKAATHTD